MIDNKLLYEMNLRLNNNLTKRDANIFKGIEETSCSKYKLYSPVVQLKGHGAELFTGKFSKNGLIFASAGCDRNVNLWSVFSDNCKNIATLTGHTNAITELAWSDEKLFTCSVDKNVFVWDYFTGTRQKKLKGHSNVVNSLDISKRTQQILISAGEDCNCIIWDLRIRKEVQRHISKYQLTSCAINEHGTHVWVGGIDNTIRCINLAMGKEEYSMQGHLDTISSIRLSNDESSLLSFSFDGTMRTWDVRSFSEDRLQNVFIGATSNFENNLLKCAWNSDDSMVAIGSADRHIYVWNAHTAELEAKLTGHSGSVNEVSFCPKGDKIISSVSSDTTAIIGRY